MATMLEDATDEGRVRRVCRRARACLRAWRARLEEAEPERAFHAESLAYVFVFSVVLMLVVGRGFLTGVPAGTSLGGWLAALVAFVSNNVMLCLIPMIPLAPAALLVRRWWFTLAAVPAAYAVLNFLVYADCIVYLLYGYHFNWMIWNILTTPGASDSYTLGAGTWVSASLVGVFVLAAELGFALAGLDALRRRSWLVPLRSRRALLTAGAAAFAVLLLDKSVYAWGDLGDRTEITRVRTLYPLYQPATIKGFAKKWLGIESGRRVSLRVDVRSSTLDYPKAEVSFREDGPRPNVVVITLEGGRYDLLTPEVMPELHRWAGEHLRFDRHFSSGNASRFGVFGLIYGIHGSYWHTVLAERRGPVLVGALKDLGYSFRILSSTDLNFPEFRRTAFIEVLEDVTDEFGPGVKRVERDRILTDRFVEFVERAQQPFFAFMFYDAPHQPYLYPPEHEAFPTTIEPGDINYVRLAERKQKVEPILRRYKNSLHYADAEIARSLAALEERGLMGNTLVFVTGDHGEEFDEFGRLGHNNAFDLAQASVFMAAHVPGEGPRKVTRLTSHVDVVPTVLEYMGCRNPASDYSQGTPLTAAEGPPSVFCASWDTAAVIDESAITVFGLELYGPDVTIHDWRYVPLPDQGKAFAERRETFLRALEGLREFSR